MEKVRTKRTNPPQPEPTTYGKCRVVSRNPISIPLNSKKADFDKYGFYNYQPNADFNADLDIYPIQKKEVTPNAIYQQSANAVDVFILRSGTLPADAQIKTIISQLLEAVKVTKSKPQVTYQRENYIFLEKTTSRKLLFIDKGQTNVSSISVDKNVYYHIKLPIIVLSSTYDYKAKNEMLYFLQSQSALNNYIENNDGDGAFSISNSIFTLPEDIRNLIVENPQCVNVQTEALPFYNNQWESTHPLAPKAIFSIRSGFSNYNLNDIFDSSTGAFRFGHITDAEAGIRYEVAYNYLNPTSQQPFHETHVIAGKLEFFGDKIEATITARKAYKSNKPLVNPWYGVVFKVNESVVIKAEVAEILADGGKPAGCPPQ